MHLMFVHHVIEDRGSAQDIYNYARVARTLGHEVTLYGARNPRSAFNYSKDLRTADAVVFIVEWTTDVQNGDLLDMLRLFSRVPRDRRVVIDCDGKYNDAIDVIGDANHADAESSRRWVDICDSLSDKIVQPTYHPLRPNVRPFFFHAYNPAWEMPLNGTAKAYDVVYVGNNWFRWRALRGILEAIEPIRDRVGRIGLVGHGWDALAPWAGPTLVEDAYYRDPAYLKKLDVEVLPPVRFDDVMPCMSRGVVSPVIYRPLFDRLQLVTCRSFETPAASTIPLFAQEEGFVTDVYGPEGAELTLPAREPHQKILDVLDRPHHYQAIVGRIRRHLGAEHSYSKRLQELIEIVES
jgi:hypothetical protein